MKDSGVCIGCKYHVERGEYSDFDDTCDYITMTGHSRIVVEMENGGIKNDSCICYEKGERKNRGQIPWSIKRGAKNEG